MPLRDQLAHECRIDDRSACGDPFERVGQVGRAEDSALQQVADPPAVLEQVDRGLDLDVGGEQQDADLRELLPDRPRRVETFPGVRRRHPDVDHGHVRDVRSDRLGQRVRVAGLVDDVVARLAQDAGDTLADEDVVVRYDHSALRHLARSLRPARTSFAGSTSRRKAVIMSRALVAQDDVRRLVDEQAALRRVATLVAEGATAADLFSGVAREVSEVLGVPTVTVSHYEPDRSFTVIASTNNPGFPVGSRWPMDGPSLAATIHDTGRAARIDEYSNLPGVVAAAVRDSSIRSAVGAPIVVDGSVWGHISVAATDPVPLPTDTERRLRDFTELVETAISNAEARDDLRRLADEQAALQRVATLVLDGAAANELFAAVAEEVARVLEVSSVGVSRFEPDGTSEVVGSLNDPGFPVGSRWPVQGPSLNAAVFETGRPARIDRHADLPGPVAAAARVPGVASAIAAPIIVSGSVWGMISIGQRDRDDVLPAATDSRLAAFTELVATAIANAQAHDDVRRLADEQAALRRVATLVAEGAPPEALFAALGEEVARLLHVSSVTVDRYEADSSVVIASINDPGFPVGSRWPLDGPSLGKAVFETGRPARIGDYADLAGTIVTAARSWNVSSAVGVPIIVDGEVWGVICVSTKTHGGVLPPETDARLAAFTELVATAISNAQARNDLRQLAEEQAALRRVATLVARGTYSEVVFDAVCAETGRVVGATSVNLARFTDDGFNLTMAGWSLRETHVPVGTRLPLAPDTIGDLIVRTTAPARKDSYDGGSSELATLVRKSGIRSAVAAPVIVEGRV